MAQVRAGQGDGAVLKYSMRVVSTPLIPTFTLSPLTPGRVLMITTTGISPNVDLSLFLFQVSTMWRTPLP